MADLTITRVRVVKEFDYFESPAAESLAEGGYARMDTTTGKAVNGNASSAGEVGVYGGIVAGDTYAAGRTAHVVVDGVVDVGEALASLTFDDLIYLSDTDSTFADSAGTVSTVVATVVPGWAFGSTADKLMRITGKKPS